MISGGKQKITKNSFQVLIREFEKQCILCSEGLHLGTIGALF